MQAVQLILGVIPPAVCGRTDLPVGEAMGGSEVGGALGDLLAIVGDAAAAFGDPTRDEAPLGCSFGDALGLC